MCQCIGGEDAACVCGRDANTVTNGIPNVPSNRRIDQPSVKHVVANKTELGPYNELHKLIAYNMLKGYRLRQPRDSDYISAFLLGGVGTT